MAAVLTGLAADLDVEQVRALLLNRRPDLLDEEASPAEHDLFVNAANGIATEVRAIVGETQANSNIRTTAVWAVTLGTAHLIEAALFPEQQLGDNARAEVLRRRYEAVLALLRGLDPNDDNSTSGSGISRGDGFPLPAGYPDPARGSVSGVDFTNWPYL